MFTSASVRGWSCLAAAAAVIVTGCASSEMMARAAPMENDGFRQEGESGGDAESDVIHACYHKENGMLRVVDDPSECRPSEEPISWTRGETTADTPDDRPCCEPEYVGDPRDMVQVHEGTPFVVPDGALFVLTALGSVRDQHNCHVYFKVDNSPEVGASGRLYVNVSSTTMQAIPSGLTVGAGRTITVEGISCTGMGESRSVNARAWGYLVWLDGPTG